MTADTDALRLVPVEPTEAMLNAACDVGPDTNNGCFSRDDARSVYVAMLAASPAVQPAAGREEIARIIDPSSFSTQYFAHKGRVADALAKADAILAAISTPAQASESGGAWADIAARLNPDLFSSDERTAHRAASPYAVSIKRAEAVAEVGRVLAAAAALSAPQAAPGEGEGES